MQVFDTKSEDISLSSNIIRGEKQIPDNHRLSKKILSSSKGITSYFSFYQPLVTEKNEDITSFSLLCNQLEQQKVFEINISNLKYPQKKFLLFVEALKRNKNLKIFNLTDSGVHWDKLAKLCLSLEQMPLEELRFKGNRLTDISISTLELALKGNKTLKVIDFSSNKIGSLGLKHFHSVLENVPFEELSLRSNHICSIFYLGKALKNNASLRILDLSDNCIGDLGSQLSPIFQNLPLEELYLRLNKLSADAMPPLKKAFEKNTTLKVLDISYNKILDRGFNTLCPVFKNMPLEKLILSTINITDDLMLPLRKSLENNRTLKVLDLSNNRIKDKGLAILCPIFKNMPLEKLIFSKIDITNDSMLHLRKSLENNRTLKVLNLSDNRIGDKGLAVLCPVFKNMPLEELGLRLNCIENIPPKFNSFLANSSIRTVHFENNKLTEKSIKGIVLALKDNVHIKRLSGINKSKKLLRTFHPLMDFLTSLGQGPKAKDLKNDFCISTKNFPRSLKALNAAFEAHIQVVDLVDIISSYTFNIDTLSDLHCLPRNV